VVGSNIANILLIMGLTAIIFPVGLKKASVWRDVLFMAGVTCLMAALLLWGYVGFWMGMAMVVGLLVFVVWQFLGDRPEQGNTATGKTSSPKEGGFRSIWTACGTLGLGLGALVCGGEFLVKGAVSAGLSLGIPEAFIGLTVVAVGTSLPELATSISAGMQRKPDIIVGNIIGSNIFNVLGIIGATAILSPLHASGLFGVVEVAALVLSAAAMVALVWLKSVSRLMGSLLVVAYVVFVALQYMLSSGGL
jgi:cation:H+ antiporter